MAFFIALALTALVAACGHNGPDPATRPSSNSPTSSSDNKGVAPHDGYCTDILTASGLKEALDDRVWSVLGETVVDGGVSCTINGATRPTRSTDVSTPTALSFRLTVHVTDDGSDANVIDTEYEDRLKWLTAAGASDQMFVGGAERSAVQGWWSQGDRFASLQSSGSSTNLLVESLVVGDGAYVSVTTRCTTGTQSGDSVNQALLTPSDALLASIPQN